MKREVGETRAAAEMVRGLKLERLLRPTGRDVIEVALRDMIWKPNSVSEVRKDIII